MSELDKFDFNKLNSIFEKITTVESLEVFTKMLFLVDMSSEVYSEFLDKIEVKKQEVNEKNTLDEIDTILKYNNFKTNKDLFKDRIENLVKEYRSKNYNMTELKARLKKYFETV